MTAPAQYRKPVRLALAALAAAVEKDWSRATATVERISRECAGPGLFDALVTWCEAFSQHSNDGVRPLGGKVRMVGWDVDTGKVGEQVKEETQWAMDLIKARAEGDLDAFNTLVKRLNDEPDGYRRGQFVSALVVTVSTTIRALPRGYATMGRQ